MPFVPLSLYTFIPPMILKQIERLSLIARPHNMINTILIDDEKNCLSSLEILLTTHCPSVNILRKCQSAQESLPLIVNKLHETGLRDRIKVNASGKMITPGRVATMLDDPDVLTFQLARLCDATGMCD